MKNKYISTFAFILFATYLILTCNLSIKSAAASVSSSAENAPQVTAETAIVADADTGYIYYNKNMHKQMYPASITKILTGLVAVENGKDSDLIQINGNISAGMPSDAARIYLEDGEEITQEEALYTMFLASANDSANALAVHIGGSIENFVNMMNARAKDLGAVDSHFSNANGLPDKNNVTSAYDMALITKKALQESALMKYFGAKSYVMPATNKRASEAYLTLHKMMKNTAYRYDGVIAGKTGWETMSGHTLVTAAKRDNRTLICVVMKSSDGHSVYKDTIALLNYCFSLPVSNSSGEYLASPIKTVGEIASTDVGNNISKAANTAINPPKSNNNIVPVIIFVCSVLLFVLLLSAGKRMRKLNHSIKNRTTNNI